jgi:hypothetical protein
MERFESFEPRTELPEGAVEVVSDELNNFRQEIGERRSSLNSENLNLVNLEELTEQDLKMYQKVLEQQKLPSLSETDYELILQDFVLYQALAGQSSESRGYFASYLSGLVMGLMKKFLKN